MVSVGVVGIGQMGLQHATIVSSLDGHQVRAMCDKESLLVRMARKVLPNLHFYTDYNEMLERESLDAVFVCTPALSHESIVTDIIDKDKAMSLFVEKPLAANYDAAMRMVHAARRSTGKMMVGFQKRFTGVFGKTKELLNKDALGGLLFFRCHVLSSDVLKETQGWKFEKESGGAILDFGPHLLDLLIWYFGEPLSVESFKKHFFSFKVEDFAHSVVNCKNGLVGYVDIGWSMRNYRPHELSIEIHGKHGSLNVTEDRLVVYLDRDVPGMIEKGVHAFHTASLTPQVPFLLTYPEYTLEDQCFLNCVESNLQPEQDFKQAARVNRLIKMIQESCSIEK